MKTINIRSRSSAFMQKGARPRMMQWSTQSTVVTKGLRFVAPRIFLRRSQSEVRHMDTPTLIRRRRPSLKLNSISIRVKARLTVHTVNIGSRRELIVCTLCSRYSCLRVWSTGRQVHWLMAISSLVFRLDILSRVFLTIIKNYWRMKLKEIKTTNKQTNNTIHKIWT